MIFEPFSDPFWTVLPPSRVFYRGFLAILSDFQGCQKANSGHFVRFSGSKVLVFEVRVRKSPFFGLKIAKNHRFLTDFSKSIRILLGSSTDYSFLGPEMTSFGTGNDHFLDPFLDHFLDTFDRRTGIS